MNVVTQVCKLLSYFQSMHSVNFTIAKTSLCRLPSLFAGQGMCALDVEKININWSYKLPKAVEKALAV